MSECGYDNVELNELINDLKKVGRNGNSSERNTRTKFNYTSPSSAVLERREVRPFAYDSQNRKTEKENNTNYYSGVRNVKNNEFNKTNQNQIKYGEYDDLQMELSKVKEELAMLKRTTSLAGHPIFGNSNPPNEVLGAEKNKRIMVSSQYNLPHSVNSHNTIQKNNTANYGSVTNVAYQTPLNSKFQYQSLNRLNNTPNFSAHRENMEKIRRATSLATQSSKQEIASKCSEEYYEESEDCTLEPIGKGFQTFSDSASNISKSEHHRMQNNFKDFSQTPLIYSDQIKIVKKMKQMWLQLDSSRESCKRKLQNKETGSFIIRIQSGYKFSGGLMFELILKVSDKEISPMLEDENFEYFPIKEFSETNIKGIKLIGHALEPMFYSLESFVVQHLNNPLGLPCCLKLPNNFFNDNRMKSPSPFNTRKISLPFNMLSKKISGSLTSLSSIKSQFTISTYAEPSQEKIEADLFFLGKVKVDRLNGANAVRHAVDKVLINGYQPKHCIEITAQFDSLSGITLVDNDRILFFKKLLSSNAIVCACVDPLHRGLNNEYFSSKGMRNSKIFGIVCHKRKILLKEHQVYVFGEFNAKLQMEKIMRFIEKHFTKQNLINY